MLMMSDNNLKMFYVFGPWIITVQISIRCILSNFNFHTQSIKIYAWAHTLGASEI